MDTLLFKRCHEFCLIILFWYKLGSDRIGGLKATVLCLKQFHCATHLLSIVFYHHLVEIVYNMIQ